MRSRMLFFIVALLVLGVDVASKQWALLQLADGQRIGVVGDLLRLQLTVNPGAAFSMGTSVTWVFTALAATVVTAITVYAGRVTSTIWRCSLGALAGGAAGNLMDRLFRPPSFGMGHVVDFIATPNFPVFNLADSAIVCSVIVMFLASSRGVPMADNDVRSGEHAA